MVGMKSPILKMLKHKPIAQFNPFKVTCCPLEKAGSGPIDTDQINDLWKPRPHESSLFASTRCSYEFSVKRVKPPNHDGKVEDGECQVYEYAGDNPWNYTRRVVFRRANDVASCQSFCNYTLRTTLLVCKQQRNQTDRACQSH